MPLIVPFLDSKDDSKKDAQCSSEPVKSGAPDKNDKEETKAQPEHFEAMPGPAVPSDTSVFEAKASSEELHAKAKELNK